MLVIEVNDEEPPENVRTAFRVAARMLHGISEEFEVCLPCLVFLLATSMERAVEEGSATHMGGNEENDHVSH